MKNKLLFRKAVTQLFLSLCLMLFCANTSWGQTIFNSPGSSTYTVPAGVTSITLEVWGGGGAGGSVKTISPGANSKGGGGAGGGFATKTITVTPGQVISYTVGGGGVSSVPTVNNAHLTTADGGNTTVTVNGIEILKALGGPGGNDGYNPTDTAVRFGFGAVAPTSGNTGDTVWYGGNGGIALDAIAAGTAGGGGGSAGRSGNGGNGALTTGGVAGTNGGAAGGLGQTNNAVSTAGTAPGAGGGGARTLSANVTTNGSAGAAGRLVITVNSNSVLSATGTTLAAFLASTATASAIQSFSVSGTELTADLVVSTASTDFELSATNFATAGVSSITLSGATVSATTIYVRLKAGLAFGSKTATVSIASTGASAPPDVSLSGTVTNVFYYDGSGSLSDVTNWGVNADGTGTNPALLTDIDTSFVIANGPATTDAAWILGTGSKVIVGNGASATLTVANTFPITGTIDATATGSVFWQHVSSAPTFGTLAYASEVHLQPATAADYALGLTTSYGKLFIDGAGKVGVLAAFSNATVRNSLTVELGSTLEFPVTNTHYISMIAGASVTINGTVRAGRQGGLLGISPAANASGSTGISILFADATPNLTLGTSSTIDYYRTNAIQTISVLPAGKNYANLTLTEINATAATTKSIAGAITVNGTLTVDLAGKSFTSVTSGANNIILANGATINMISGTLNTAPNFAGTVNVTYSGLGFTKINAVTTIGSTAVTLASANAAIVAGMAVTGTAVAAGTTVASISGTALVLSAAATATETAVKLSFATGTAQTTGFEVPTVASNALNNLTINNSSGLILSAATKGNSIIANTDNILTLSTADLLDANVQVNGASELTLNVSANQANLKQIVFSAPTTAKLKLIATSTSTIAFANSSAQNWGTGTVEITGFVEGNIKFGSSKTALTSTQLGLIKDTADLTKTFRLSDQGYLYYSTTIVSGDAFVVTSENPVYLATAVASTYVITTTAPNTATSFVLGATALPEGLSLNTTTGAITGTPTTATVVGLVVPITLSNAVNSQTINFTVNIKTRDAQTITWSQGFPATNTYGDAAIALTATTSSPLVVSYSSSNTAVATISGSTLTIVGPGTTTITASQAGDPDYSPATNGTKELVVNAKALTIDTFACVGKIYDKNDLATVTGTLAGVLVGADVVTLVLSGIYDSANAGSRTVTSTSTLTGADAAKYSLTQPTALTNVTIAQKAQTLAGIGGQSVHILGDADYYPYSLMTDPTSANNAVPGVSEPIENPNYTYTSSNSLVATVVTDGNGKEMIHVVGLGTAEITAKQSGTDNFIESDNVPHTLTVLPVPLASWDLYNFNVTSTSPQATSTSASQSLSGIATPTIGIGNHTTGLVGQVVYPFGTRYRFNSSDWPYLASNATELDGITPKSPSIDLAEGKYMSVVIQGNPGKSMSLSTLNATFRGAGNTTNQMLSQFAYSINGGSFTAIGTPTSYNIVSGIKYHAAIDLSGIAALQNLPSGATVTLRYYASGKYGELAPTTNNGRQWGFTSEYSQGNTRALIIGGSVATAALVAPVVQNTTMCKGALNVNPSATALNGYELLWYTAATGGTPTTTAPIITATKISYVAQRFIGDVATNISARVPVTVTVVLLPATPSTLTSLQAKNICKYIGSGTPPVTFDAAPVSGASTYTWTVPTGAEIVGNATGSSVAINFAGAITAPGVIGSVTVKSVDNVTSCASVAKALVLTTKLPTAPTALLMTSLNETPHFKGIITQAVGETPAVYGLVGLNTLTAGIKKVGPYTGTETVFTMTAPVAPTAASYLWTLPTGVNAIASETVAISSLGVVTSTSPVITANFAGVTPGTAALPIVVQSVAGCGNSTNRTLSLARALPTAPTALVLTNATQTNLSSLAKITKVGPYTGTEIPFTLTATPFTTQGATSTSYAWILPAGVTCETAYTEKTVYQNVNVGSVEVPNIVYTPFTAKETATNVITVKFGNATKAIGNLDLLVFGLNGAGNSLARKLTLSRALPTAPTALVLRDGTTVVTKVGPYTTKETPLTLTATPFTTQGAEATSFSWVLPAGVNVTAGVDAALLLTPPATVGTTKTWTGTSSVLTINLNGIGTAITSIPLSVYAVNGAGTSAAARTLTVTAAAPATPAITGATTYNSCNNVTYTATLIPGATYNWVVPANATFTQPTVNTISVDYSTVTVPVNASAAVTCSATNGTGTSAIKSLTVKRVVCPAKLSNPTTADFSAVAYPNPSTEGFKVKSSNGKSFGVQVYDMLGRSIEKRQMTSDAPIGSNYAKGIYNVIVTQGANVKTVRIIKK